MKRKYARWIRLSQGHDVRTGKSRGKLTIDSTLRRVIVRRKKTLKWIERHLAIKKGLFAKNQPGALKEMAFVAGVSQGVV